MTTIIIPNYNCRPYLGQCINSVKRQSNRDWECIILDDASTDGSLDEIGSLTDGDRRFTVVCSTKNMGPSAARNKGMDMAGGEYLFFLDSDDWLHPNALDILTGEAGVRHGAVRIVSLDMRHRVDGSVIGHSITPAGMHRPEDPYLFSGYDCDPGHATGCLYVRNNMPLHLRFPDVRLFEDMVFNMGLLFAGKSTFIMDRYLYNYRQRSGSLVGADLSPEQAEATRQALRDLAIRYRPEPEVYERCRTFLENALNGKLNKK